MNCKLERRDLTFSGVLLDIDGTLVLSNDAHARAWIEAFAAFDRELEFDQVRPLIGMDGDRIISKFLPGGSDKEGEGKKIADLRKKLIIDKFAADLVPANGARDLIIKMQQQLDNTIDNNRWRQGNINNYGVFGFF